MSIRYLTNAAIALLGGLVVVASQAFAPATVAWLATAVAIAVLVISVAAQLDRARGPVQRALDAAGAVASVVLIVFALILTGTAVSWFAFALALGYVAVAFAGLTFHEVGSWRADHHLEQLHWIDRRAGSERRSVPVDARPAADHPLAA